MKIEKATWQTDKASLNLRMPISKVDQENRLVSGFATLDNIDTSGDVVTSDASARAFSRFRGNIREMHEPIAAGRLVDFSQESYYDPDTETFYSGIYVTAYVSKGAQATWEKVLDGTLSGFSIGGNIIEANSQYIPDVERTIRFITDYDLVELSLVDSPANQLANIFSVVKSSDGTTVKGMIAETLSQNVFWCSADNISKASPEDSAFCPNCSAQMQNIGWFEYSEGEEIVDKLKEVFNDFKSNSVEITEKKANEGGVDVADTTNDVTTEVEEEVVTDESVVAEEEVETVANKAADVTEVEVEEPDFAKMLGDLRESVEKSLSDGLATTNEEIEKIRGQIEDIKSVLDGKVSEISSKQEEVEKRLADIHAEYEKVEKRLGSVEADTAVKKSGSVETETEIIKKSKWGGTFLGKESL